MLHGYANDYVCDAMLECYQWYTSKMTNIAKLKTALLTIWNDLPYEFVDKAIVSFHNSLQQILIMLLQLVDISDTQFKYWVKNLNS